MVLGAALVCMFTVLRAEESGRAKSFAVGKGGTLEVSTSVGDIRIVPWDKNEAYIQVEGLEDEELDHVQMTQTGSVVRVVYRSKWSSWSGSVQFIINVPSKFNLDLSTSGGDLTVEGSLTGKVEGMTSGGSISLGTVAGGPVEMTTSGGDITAKNLEGESFLKTAGGDIHVLSASGPLTVNTSGGDIKIESASKSLDAKTSGGDIVIGNVGGEAKVSTSGGDIEVGKVSGQASLNTAGGDIVLKGASGRVTAKTSGGDVQLFDITGSVKASSSGGSVEARLIPAGNGNSRLSSSGGPIRLYVSEKARATIEATIKTDGWMGFSRRHGSHYVVRSEFPKDSYETDNESGEIQAVYKIGGGGDLIELSTSDSDIEIYKLR
jgi:hypothetical protein